MAPFSALPTEIIFQELSYLSAHDLLLSAQSVSRQFYELATAVLRLRTRALLRHGNASLIFEVGLPSDGPFVKKHELLFSHVTPPPNHSPLYDPHSSILTLTGDETTLLELEKSPSTLITPPRVHLTFPENSAPFPINIETPFESFRTVIWRVWIHWTPQTDNPTASVWRPHRSQGMVSSGIQRFRQKAFATAPICEEAKLSDPTSSLLSMTLLPASSLSATPSPIRPRNSWDGAIETFGVRFNGMDICCGSVLLSHEGYQKGLMHAMEFC